MRRLSLPPNSSLLPHAYSYGNGKDKVRGQTFQITAGLCLIILIVLVVNAHLTILDLKDQLQNTQECVLQDIDKKWGALLDQEKERKQEEIRRRTALDNELATCNKQYESCRIRDQVANTKNDKDKYPLPSPYYPPDFERMYPDMFGPRPTPLIPGSKILFVMAVGNSGKNNLDAIITQLGLEHFTYILLHYDNTSFSEYSWNHDVIHISMHRQMKWWYIKRFIHPEIASFYEYVYVMDEDCILPATWNNTKFLDIARRNHLDIFQPSHNNSLHKIINTYKGHQSGRFTNFVEVGPFTIFSPKGYHCVWNMFLPDVVGGWGYDLFFYEICKAAMGVIDSMPIYHADTKTASNHESALKEQSEVLDRYKNVPHTWFGKMKNKGLFY